jgi:hypothetical protein
MIDGGGPFRHLGLMLDPQVRRQPEDLLACQGSHRRCNRHFSSGPEHDETAMGELDEMDGAPEGAAALRGGGESAQVGDRPRTEDGYPEPSDVGMGHGEAVRSTWQDPRRDGGSLDHRWSEAAIRRARSGRGLIGIGRTDLPVSRIERRRSRCVMHGKEVSYIII